MEDKNEKRKLEGVRNPDKKTINVPDNQINFVEHTVDEIDKELHERTSRIEKEFLDGFHALRQYPKSVTFFGSARFPENNKYYKLAQEIAGRLCEKGYTVITGGGPGIMEAGNRGTKETCGIGVGLNIELPSEQIINPYVTEGVNFHYFFARKVVLSFSAEAYLFFPGGFGTLDEFFELITLMQTKKIRRAPLILIGSEFWVTIHQLISEVLLNKFGTITPDDVTLYHISDDVDEIIEMVEKANTNNEYSQTHGGSI